MEVVLKKMGNSTALILPPPVLRDLGLAAGHALTLETTADRRLVLTPRRKYTLDEMIAACDLSAPPPADMDAWDGLKPEGGEAW
ncbi:AbrB/MazE/SpoVT family DNA-binding domain-containing protein [Roseateles sp. 22389]|uniref:AbrB/MazE/SpoVT family DNA-binding domain-containing protein n=1 Tax=Roseateles sp. 22389 TaxID=3453916 RepID=UPI003F827600